MLLLGRRPTPPSTDQATKKCAACDLTAENGVEQIEIHHYRREGPLLRLVYDQPAVLAGVVFEAPAWYINDVELLTDCGDMPFLSEVMLN